MYRLFEFSIEEQIACIAREIQLRGKVYGRWITEKRMTREKAEHEFRCMQAVRDTLVAIRDGNKLPLDSESALDAQQRRHIADL